MASIYQDAVQAAPLVLALLAGVLVFLKALAGLLGFIGAAFWPPALKAAAWCSTAWEKVHELGAALGSLFPATAAAKAFKASRKVGPAIGLLVCGFFLGGCAWFASHPAVAPDAQAIEACVAGEIAKDAPTGETAMQVAVDVGAACGSQAATLIEAALAQSPAGAGTKAGVLRAARR